ncbi:extensin [Amylibacter ulvae]|uniref:Extensin n=2 Tax=Paramylibacter ulvae TaxID=1651968 RepID=A0ABQ3CXS2_9RHOB|nr:extensin [Amylibacter ulvae]
MFSLCLLWSMVIAGLIYLPNSPLPDMWNPTTPFDPTAQFSAFSNIKLNRVLKNPTQCGVLLAQMGANFQSLSDRVETNDCNITNRVVMRGAGQSVIAPLETKCEIALRLALWERHALQSAAFELLGQSVARVEHFASFSCRPIRTTNGQRRRMSEHATANAVDIAGFVLADGQKISVLSDWDDQSEKGEFLRTIRDGACDWFKVTLSPDYNALHKDHFHFDQGRWNSCR